VCGLLLTQQKTRVERREKESKAEGGILFKEEREKNPATHRESPALKEPTIEKGGKTKKGGFSIRSSYKARIRGGGQ